MREIKEKRMSKKDRGKKGKSWVGEMSGWKKKKNE